MAVASRWHELDGGRSWRHCALSLWHCSHISAITLSQILRCIRCIFIVMAVIWGGIFEGIAPDRFDIIGAAIALVGVAIIFYMPRKGEESVWSQQK